MVRRSGGRELRYVEELTVHHQASVLRDPHARRRLGVRNTLWLTWLRRPLRPALRRTVHLAWPGPAWPGPARPRDRVSALGAFDALRGMRWLLTERRARPPAVETRLVVLDETQRRSRARRYVS